MICVAVGLAYHPSDPVPVRLVLAIALTGAFFLWALALRRTYPAALSSAHLKVVDRPELGDAARYALFLLATVGYPLLLLGLFARGFVAVQVLSA